MINADDEQNKEPGKNEIRGAFQEIIVGNTSNEELLHVKNGRVVLAGQGLLPAENIKATESTVFSSEDDVTKSKAQAFDDIVAEFTASGFDMSMMSHVDSAAMIKTLSLEGLEQTARKLLSSSLNRFYEIEALAKQFTQDASSEVGSFLSIMNGFEKLRSDVDKITSEIKIDKKVQALDEKTVFSTIFNIGKATRTNPNVKLILSEEQQVFAAGLLEVMKLYQFNLTSQSVSTGQTPGSRENNGNV